MYRHSIRRKERQRGCVSAHSHSILVQNDADGGRKGGEYTKQLMQLNLK